MRKLIFYTKWPRRIEWQEKIQKLRAFAEESGRELKAGPISFVSVSASERFNVGTLAEVEQVLREYSHCEELELNLILTKADAKESLKIEIDSDASRMKLAIGADDLHSIGAVQMFLERQFGLEHPTSPPDRGRPQRKVFLGYHYDDDGKMCAERVGKFLRLLGFTVDEAVSFESRSIPDKVRALIEPNEIYVGIVTGDRTHEWLTAEVAYAVAKEMRVVILLQKGCVFNPGFAGRDHETLSFDHIEQSFIGLLEYFSSIRVIGL